MWWRFAFSPYVVYLKAYSSTNVNNPSVYCQQITCPKSPKRSNSQSSQHSSDHEVSSVHSGSEHGGGSKHSSEHGGGSRHSSESEHTPFVPRSSKRNAVLYEDGADIPPTRPGSPNPGSDSDSPEHLTEEEIKRRREREEHNKKPFVRPGSTGTFGGGHHPEHQPGSEHSEHEHEPKHRHSRSESVEGGYRSRQNSLSSQTIDHPPKRRGSQSG